MRKLLALGLLLVSSLASATSTFDDVVVENSCTIGALNGVLKASSGLVSGSATTSDLSEGSNLYFTNARADARITAQKGVALGLATLDGSGKLPTSQLSPIAITNTYVVASQAAMLALSAHIGDVAVRTDASKSFILAVDDPTILINWVELLAPLSDVISVNGQTGVVNLTTDDISEGVTNLYYTDGRVRAAVSPMAPITFNSMTGVFGIAQSTSMSDGYLSAVDWASFDSKEPGITAGTSSQYWRGDKTFQTLDTAAVPENVNLYYTAARFNTAFAAKTTTDLSEGLNLYYTAARFNTAFAAKSTSDLSEGTNLYYTAARFNTAFSAKSTSDLTEGSNLYFTNARVDTEFDTRLATKTTTNLAEGSNLYYTDARVKTLAAASMPVQEMYVTKDVGNDANDCSLLKPCKTIQAGITAANAIAAYYKPVIVHVAPSFGGTGSSYNENITFSQQGVNLLCDVPQNSQRACQISGTVTINMTGTSGGANYVAASNEAYMNGFVVGVNSAGSTLTFSGTTFQRFILINSYIDQNGSGNAVVLSNSGTSGGSPSLLKVIDSDINNSNATSPAVDFQAGRFWLYGTTSTISNGNAAGPSVTQSGATSSFIANIVQLTGQYNLTSNTATATFNLSTIASGANPCIVTPSSPNTGYALLAYFGCNSTATNSITGTGVVANAPGNVRFGSSGDIVSTVTQASIGPGLPQGELLLGPGATTGTNVLLSIKDGHTKIGQTTAPTRTLSGNAGSGGTPSCTLTNATDTAGKIALVTGTSAWASGTQCTVTFNKAYSVAPICVFSPNNANAASKAVSQQINFTTTTTTMLVSFGAADTAQTTYNWMYNCLETQ